MTTVPCIGVNPTVYREGVAVLSIHPKPIQQSDPPRPYGHDGFEESLILAYEDNYKQRHGTDEAPARTLAEWRKPDEQRSNK